MRLGGAPVISNCVFDGNSISVEAGTPRIESNLLIQSTVTLGSTDNALVLNNAFVGAGVETGRASTIIVNNIITQAARGVSVSGGALPTIRHNDVWGNTVNYYGVANPTGTNGTTNDDVKSFTTKIGNNIIEQRSLARRRFAKSHGGGRLDISHTLDMYFATETQLRKYLGVSDALYPVIPTNTVLTGAVQLEFTNGVEILKIYSPTCEFECPAPAVAGEDFLSIQLTATALEHANGAVQVTLVSSDANATIIAAGTGIAAGS